INCYQAKYKMRKNVRTTTCFKIVVFVSFTGILLYFHNTPVPNQGDKRLVLNTNTIKKGKSEESTFNCSIFRKLIGQQNIEFPSKITWEQIYKKNDNVTAGGQWSPTNCGAEDEIAIIIAYRDREEHLKQFLNYMHPFLQRQKLSYRIVVVEQNKPAIFNKASLFNTGFKIISELGINYTCFIFHDVDIFPENDRMIYSCQKKIVLHLAAYIDVHNYKKPPYTLTGGVVAIAPDTYKKLNGYSNGFWGWGGEDNDLLIRCLHIHVPFRQCINWTECRYTTLKHSRDQGNPENHVHYILNKKEPDFRNDGLTTVNFTLHAAKQFKLFTWLYVSFDTSTLTRENTDFFGADADAAIAMQEKDGRSFDEYLW
ncbi:unnamed protein product, partial [Owenia fusiformis]